MQAAAACMEPVAAAAGESGVVALALEVSDLLPSDGPTGRDSWMAANSRIFQHPDPKLSSSPLAHMVQLVVELVHVMVGMLPDLGRLWLPWTGAPGALRPMVADHWVEPAQGWL